MAVIHGFETIKLILPGSKFRVLSASNHCSSKTFPGVRLLINTLSLVLAFSGFVLEQHHLKRLVQVFEHLAQSAVVQTLVEIKQMRDWRYYLSQQSSRRASVMYWCWSSPAPRQVPGNG